MRERATFYPECTRPGRQASGRRAPPFFQSTSEMTRHFLSQLDLDRDTAATLLDRAIQMKREGFRSRQLEGRIFALIFEKASTRTRVSFETAIRHLGGDALFMTPRETQLGRNEPLKDTARVLSRYVDGLVVRTFGQEILEELAEWGDIPVVNALSDKLHPCQLMADLMTLKERFGDLNGLPVAWIGDGNNMANSWLESAALLPIELRLACPEGYEPDPLIVDAARDRGANFLLTRDPMKAVDGAKAVNTDVWVSMGQEDDAARIRSIFEPYQVDDALMAAADPDAIFLHCLPAHRGEEVTESVIESPASAVWDQAENRLHAQKALLEYIFS